MAKFDPRKLLEVLAGHRVDFIIIGATAVGAHGYQRATKDIDIVPEPSSENLKRLSHALVELDASIEGVDSDKLGIKLDPDGLGMGGNFVTNTAMGRLDIMQFQGDEDLYEVLSPGTITVNLGDLKVRVCSLDDLIRLKMDAARPQDLIDVEELKKRAR